MSESSDNPPPEQKPVPGDKPADPLALIPRSSLRVEGVSAPETGLRADTQISLSELMALARTLSASVPDEEDNERGTISRQQRKFSKGEKAGGAEATLGERPESPGPEGETPAAAVAARESSLPAMTARTRRVKTSKGAGLMIQGAIVLTLCALVAGVWMVAKLAQPVLAKASAPAVAATPSPETLAPLPTFSSKDIEIIDKIAAAQKANDPAKALALCVLLRSQGSRVPGLFFMEAQFAAATNDFPAAAVALNRSLAANEEVSGCHMLRAAMLARENKTDLALKAYEAAAAAAPFEARPFFFWGEALRRSGRPQAALVRLEEGIQRAKDSQAEEFYRFKQRLTLIDLDRSAEFAEERKTQLALPNPPPDWLLTAAAEELHNGAYEAALPYFDRAAKELSAAELNNRLRDFYFFGFAREPALARVFASILNPARTPVLAEPSTSPAPAPVAENETVTPLSLGPGLAPTPEP